MVPKTTLSVHACEGYSSRRVCMCDHQWCLFYIFNTHTHPTHTDATGKQSSPELTEAPTESPTKPEGKEDIGDTQDLEDTTEKPEKDTSF